MVKVDFFDPEYNPGLSLTYSVITARYRNKWIFVRHVDHYTWEIPGGHIEEGETSDETAERELFEETGAVDFDLHCVATYSVTQNGSTGWGRLYFAEVNVLGPVNDSTEIDEVIFNASMPESLTYPYIQPQLFDRVIRYIRESGV